MVRGSHRRWQCGVFMLLCVLAGEFVTEEDVKFLGALSMTTQVAELAGKMPEQLQAYWDHFVNASGFTPLPAPDMGS